MKMLDNFRTRKDELQLSSSQMLQIPTPSWSAQTVDEDSHRDPSGAQARTVKFESTEITKNIYLFHCWKELLANKKSAIIIEENSFSFFHTFTKEITTLFATRNEKNLWMQTQFYLITGALFFYFREMSIYTISLGVTIVTVTPRTTSCSLRELANGWSG